jgi:hypothetical protein
MMRSTDRRPQVQAPYSLACNQRCSRSAFWAQFDAALYANPVGNGAAWRRFVASSTKSHIQRSAAAALRKIAYSVAPAKSP